MPVRSITATRLRAFAAAMAPFWPAGPLPITTRSYSGTLTLPASAEIRLRRLAPGSTYQPDQHRLLMPIAPPAGGREYAPVLVDLLSELLPAS